MVVVWLKSEGKRQTILVGRGFVFLPYMKVLTAASLLRLFPISTQSSYSSLPNWKKNFWQEPR
jgi:hypothetical protein